MAGEGVDVGHQLRGPGDCSRAAHAPPKGDAEAREGALVGAHDEMRGVLGVSEVEALGEKSGAGEGRGECGARRELALTVQLLYPRP